MSKLPDRYRALRVSETPSGFTRSVEELNSGRLAGPGNLVRVHYSSLNYKDALSASGNRGVTSNYPHTPGIDAAGIVVRSAGGRFPEGRKVLVTGFDMGMNTPGGFGEYVQVPDDWIVPLPTGLTLKEAMIFGTAGFTAAYGVLKIVRSGITADIGPVVVTGSTGGVGSIATALLSLLGYRVTAVTGKNSQSDFLLKLGAEKAVDRQTVTDHSGRHLLKGTWAAAVDTVGGTILDTVIRQTQSAGIVVCCGNILGHSLQTSIYPFILRGIGLLGIDSGSCPMSRRLELWEKLAGDWKLPQLEEISREVSLDHLPGEIDAILKGEQSGRVVVNLLD